MNDNPDKIPPGPEPADPVARIAARTIDLLIAALLSRLSEPFGMALGLVYLLIADGMAGGQSFGKRLLGLRVVDAETFELAGVRQSIRRNAHIALLYALMFIPILGLILVAVLGTFITAVETWAIYHDPRGQRMGDLFADTMVVGEAWIRLPDQELESASP
ncbi:MAG: hypothetical protein D6761_13460 [Candidatus Dadabacteria bacterium]|nr:MAG: hypothetical protein D6761_13460 [Candidatus Dadabacteria bacterium]